MAGFAIVVYAFAVVLVVMVVWSITHRRRPAQLSARAVPVIAAARRRALIAVGFAFVVFLAGAVAGVTFPSLLGMPFAAMPLVAGASGLLLYAATPPRDVSVAAEQVRTAGLTRRSWLTTAPAGWMHVCLEVVLVFVALVIFCGVTAQADDHGRSRAIGFADDEYATLASPYPGWFYGIPALAGLALLVVSTIIALRRIVATAAFPHPDDHDADAQWRRASTAVVLKLASGALLFSVGGIAMTAGFAMRNALIEGATPVVWGVIADILSIMGVLFLVLSIVSVTLAALTAFTIGERLARLPEPVR